MGEGGCHPRGLPRGTCGAQGWREGAAPAELPWSPPESSPMWHVSLLPASWWRLHLPRVPGLRVRPFHSTAFSAAETGLLLARKTVGGQGWDKAARSTQTCASSMAGTSLQGPRSGDKGREGGRISTCATATDSVPFSALTQPMPHSVLAHLPPIPCADLPAPAGIHWPQTHLLALCCLYQWPCPAQWQTASCDCLLPPEGVVRWHKTCLGEGHKITSIQERSLLGKW